MTEPQPQSQPQRLVLQDPNSLRILAFGNSLTAGYLDFGTSYNPYATTVQSTLSSSLVDTTVSVDVNGLSGDCVLESLNGVFVERLQQSLGKEEQRGGYDIVCLLGGTNDLAHTFGDPTGPRRIFEGLKKCYEMVTATPAALVCITVPERRLDTLDNAMGRQGTAARLELNGLITAYVTEQAQAGQKVFLLNLAGKMPFESVDAPGSRGWWHFDGLHMTAQGYDNFGKEVSKFLLGLIKGTMAATT